jgi:TfoX/Sxy family transcriptional regulator of competence genes
MAYDEHLANRLREALTDERGVSEKAMFGGLGFLISGSLAVSASSQGGLLLRVDPAQIETLIREPGAQRFVMRGRVMDGWLRIAAEALEADDEFERWVRRGVARARTLPPK